MKNLIINDLCIEVTRKCNLKCPHCMRGDSQNISLNISHIEEFFNNSKFNLVSINRLIITGGEPTLNYKTILNIIKIILKNNIKLKSFIMVINGSTYNNELIEALNKLYQFKLKYDLEDTFDIICSLDQFHKSPKEEILEQYNKLPYFKANYRKLGEQDIICLGRAYLNKLGNIDTYYSTKALFLYYLNNNYPIVYEDEKKVYLEELYLSSKGLFSFHIIDATYEMIDELCIYNHSDLNNILNNVKKVKRKQK